MVVLGEPSLPFEHLDGYSLLVVNGGGEDLGLLGGDGGVSANQVGHHSSSGLNTEGQWGHVQQ